MRTAKGRKAPKMSDAAREIMAGLMEIKNALDEGVPLHERFTVREVEVVEPGHYDPQKVQASRAKLGVSQAVFARIVGVSTVLVQSWENGKRIPNAAARRILDEINREPKRWLSMLRSAPVTTRRVA